MAKMVRMHGILQASSAGWKKAIQAFRLRLHLACGSVEPTHPPKAAYEWGTRQTIYKMRCGVCRGEYGANGCDIHARLCPLCQQGKAGEVLREAGVGLFG